jgi:hypothetical protein
MEHDVQRAVRARNHGVRRVRVVTGGLIAGGVALTAALTALAGSSTHLKKTLVRRPAAAKTTTTSVTAPAPPIVAVHSQPTAQAPPAVSSAPVQTQAPPVVVSGGS